MQVRGVPEVPRFLASVVGSDGLLGVCIRQQPASAGERDLQQPPEDVLLSCHQVVRWGLAGFGPECHALHSDLCLVCGSEGQGSARRRTFEVRYHHSERTLRRIHLLKNCTSWRVKGMQFARAYALNCNSLRIWCCFEESIAVEERNKGTLGGLFDLPYVMLHQR